MEEEYKIKYELLYVRALHVAREMGFNITHESIDEGLIKFKTGMNWLTWGGTVKIWIRKESDTISKISIDSSSDAQLYSWGQNNRNKKGFMETLRESLRT